MCLYWCSFVVVAAIKLSMNSLSFRVLSPIPLFFFFVSVIILFFFKRFLVFLVFFSPRSVGSNCLLARDATFFFFAND